MIERSGDLWSTPADVRVITTNGFIKTNGLAVMGRGVAAQAVREWPSFPQVLGRRLSKYGNHIHEINFHDGIRSATFLTFPVKHNWWEDADLVLIAQSVGELVDYTKSHPNLEIVMPRPGCGNGRLLWKNVKPFMTKLPDTVTVLHYR